MSFWSGERLNVELCKGLIEPFDPSRIDCASYPLCVGDQAFVTSDRFTSSDPSAPIVSVLSDAPKHTICIPPGQFAFLLTEEDVAVPNTAIALISIKSKYKFQGLINVSGFHVDPGFRGKLLFSLYNAGPSEIILERGQRMFMIVYADLDQETTKSYAGSAQKRTGIDPSLVQGMTSQVFSPLMLQRKIDALSNRVDAVSLSAGIMKAITYAIGTVLGLVIACAAILPPATLGVILARTIEGAGYDLSPKSVLPGQAATPTPAEAVAKEPPPKVSPPPASK